MVKLEMISTYNFLSFQLVLSPQTIKIIAISGLFIGVVGELCYAQSYHNNHYSNSNHSNSNNNDLISSIDLSEYYADISIDQHIDFNKKFCFC